MQVSSKQFNNQSYEIIGKSPFDLYLYLIMKKLLALTFITIFFATVHAQSNYLLIGTYTNGGSKGIYVYKFNSSTGDFDSVSMVKTNNPSYLDISPDQKFV